MVKNGPFIADLFGLRATGKRPKRSLFKAAHRLEAGIPEGAGDPPITAPFSPIEETFQGLVEWQLLAHSGRWLNDCF